MAAQVHLSALPGNTSTTSLADLPSELIAHIAEFLCEEDIFALMASSRFLYASLTSSTFWHQRFMLYARRLTTNADFNAKNNPTWRLLTVLDTELQDHLYYSVDVAGQRGFHPELRTPHAAVRQLPGGWRQALCSLLSQRCEVCKGYCGTFHVLLMARVCDRCAQDSQRYAVIAQDRLDCFKSNPELYSELTNLPSRMLALQTCAGNGAQHSLANNATTTGSGTATGIGLNASSGSSVPHQAAQHGPHAGSMENEPHPMSEAGTLPHSVTPLQAHPHHHHHHHQQQQQHQVAPPALSAATQRTYLSWMHCVMVLRKHGQGFAHLSSSIISGRFGLAHVGYLINPFQALREDSTHQRYIQESITESVAGTRCSQLRYHWNGVQSAAECRCGVQGPPAAMQDHYEIVHCRRPWQTPSTAPNVVRLGVELNEQQLREYMTRRLQHYVDNSSIAAHEMPHILAAARGVQPISHWEESVSTFDVSTDHRTFSRLGEIHGSFIMHGPRRRLLCWYRVEYEEVASLSAQVRELVACPMSSPSHPSQIGTRITCTIRGADGMEVHTRADERDLRSLMNTIGMAATVGTETFFQLLLASCLEQPPPKSAPQMEYSHTTQRRATKAARVV